MKTSLLLVALFIGSALSTLQTTPVLIWTNKASYLKGQNLETVELTKDTDVVLPPTESSSLMKFWSTSTYSPEIIVLFLEPKMRTEQFAELAASSIFSKLKQLVESAPSSVTLPYVYSTTDATVGSTITESLLSAAKAAKATVYLASNSAGEHQGVSHMALNQLKSIATPQWSALHNGVPDVLIVSLGSTDAQGFAADDTLIASLHNAFSGVPFIALFTAEGLSTGNIKTTYPSSHPSLAAFERERMQTTLGNFNSLWPGNVIQGLIVMVPFLVILGIGIGCLFNVQSALKFDAEKNVRRVQ